MFGRRVGFLKFKADIIDKETGAKVINLTLYVLTIFSFTNLEEIIWVNFVDFTKISHFFLGMNPTIISFILQ